LILTWKSEAVRRMKWARASEPLKELEVEALGHSLSRFEAR
jgi:hypothetical protein